MCFFCTSTLNTAVQVQTPAPEKWLSVSGKKPQQLKHAFSLEFSYRVGAASPDYLAVQLDADQGPLITSNYRLALESVPLPGGKTFMHLRYVQLRPSRSPGNADLPGHHRTRKGGFHAS
jgi:hypothetical protein